MASDHRQPLAEGKAGQAEDDDFQAVLNDHAGGVGRYQRLAVAGEKLGEDGRDERAGRADHHRNDGEYNAGDGKPDLVQPLDAGDFCPGDRDDKGAEDKLHQRIGKLDHDEGAEDRADHAAGHEGRRDVHPDIGALMPGAAGVRAELDRAMHRNQHSHRHEETEQREHGDAAAYAEGRRQRRGEKAGSNEQSGGSSADAIGQEGVKHRRRVRLCLGALGELAGRPVAPEIARQDRRQRRRLDAQAGKGAAVLDGSLRRRHCQASAA